MDTLWTFLYTGKKKKNFPTGHGLSYDAVTYLLDGKVLGSGYHVYMYNFLTSPKLLRDLFAIKFGACAELTSDANNIATAGRRKCILYKVEQGKRQDIPWKCQACDAHLCLQLNRHCFQKWHKDL